MPRRLAASLALLVFAICLIAGLESGNSMSTILSRALVAMLGTLVISLIVGTMAEKMLQENVARREKELRQAGEATANEKTGGA
jgi:peptidoglycan/LPS O-acetylase OafA/YrhL